MQKNYVTIRIVTRGMSKSTGKGKRKEGNEVKRYD